MKNRLSTAITAALVAALFVASAQAREPAPASVRQAFNSNEAPKHVPNQLIVKLKPDASRKLSSAGYKAEGLAGTSLTALNSKYSVSQIEPVFHTLHTNGGLTAQSAAQATALKYPRRQKRASQAAAIPTLEDVYLFHLAKGTKSLQALRDYRKDPTVDYAELNAIATTQMVPDDPYYHSAGSWGQPYDDLYGIKKLQCEQPWDTAQGLGVVVAVIDTGGDERHPELAGNIWTNPGEVPGNGRDDDNNGFIDDTRGWDFSFDVGDDLDGDETNDEDNDPRDGDGHGTHVAGTIAAVGNNAIGVIGVALKAKIMVVRGLNDFGEGNIADLAEAVLYAADNGANISNNSWGIPLSSQLLADAFDYASSVGMINVAAAGNSNLNVSVFMPANLPSVVAVAAVDHEDRKAFFSNHGRKIDVSAPGVDILSLSANGGDNFIARNRPDLVVNTNYLRLRGTSMACPHAAGLAAVLLGAYPADSAQMILGRLMGGADNIDALNPGFEDALGAGRINALASIQMAPRPVFRAQALRSSGLSPGQTSTLHIDLKNFWQEARGVTGVLTTATPHVTVREGQTGFGDIAMGQTRTGTPLVIELDGATPLGADLPLTLTLTTSAGQTDAFPVVLRAAFFADVGAQTTLPLQGWLPWSITMRDLNGDGYSDVCFFDAFDGNLYHNNHNGTFTQAPGPFVEGFLTQTSSAAMDIDNDGDTDLFIGGLAGSRLFLNTGNGSYTEITATSGLGGAIAPAAVAVDYDRDGWADLMTARVYRNNGNRTFTDVTVQAGFPAHGLSVQSGSIAAVDYDNDGDADVLASGEGGGPTLYRNDGTGLFSDATAEALPATVMYSPLGLAAGDYNNDGFPDLFFTNFSGSPSRSALCRNNGNGTFTDVTRQAGGGLSDAAGIWGGTDFFDYDNDGDVDLYVTADPALTRNALYRNEGDGTFVEVTSLDFPQNIRPTAAVAAIGDYNNDGALDIYAPAGVLAPSAGAFFQNVLGARHHWIKIKLRGVQSNRDALGARISVRAGGALQSREVHTSAVETQPVHFGLGFEISVGDIEVRWPSGFTQIRRNVAADQLVTITERNNPPVFNPPTRQTVFESRMLTFTVSATDPDGDPLTYAVDPATLPAGATFEGQVFHWPTTLGTADGHARTSRVVPVTFTAADGTDTTSLTVNIEVYNMDIDVTGDGAINTLDWTTTGQAAAGLISDPAILARTDFNRNGSTTVTDWVWSGIVVRLLNQSPVFSAVGNYTGLVGRPLHIQVTASDSNRDPLRYTVSGLPPGAKFSPATRTLTWTPTARDRRKTYKVKFTVTDSLRTSSTTSQLTVR